jgi:hypothetical protein
MEANGRCSLVCSATSVVAGGDNGATTLCCNARLPVVWLPSCPDTAKDVGVDRWNTMHNITSREHGACPTAPDR